CTFHPFGRRYLDVPAYDPIVGCRVAIALCLLLAGCLHDELARCSDGRACPVGTACDDIHATCDAPDQLTICGGLINGDRCTTGNVVGLCDQNVCLQSCGDGAQNTPSEDCDDGNFKSHDGCSSGCVLEQPTWAQWM